MVVVLRPATAADVATCVAVQRASTTVGYAHIFDQAVYPFPEQAVHDEWVARFASTTSVTLATIRDAAVGAIGTTANRLEALFVVPEHWGRGVAGELHDHALAEIIANGFESAVLDVLSANTRARAFYERRGWELTGQARQAPWPPYPDIVSYRRITG